MEEIVEWPKAQYWQKPWNPIVGCEPISPACDHCYARTSTERFDCSFVPHETTRINPPKKGVVFCGNMTDLFGDWVGRDRSIAYIRKTVGNKHAEYLWLTKRVENMCSSLKYGEFDPSCMANQYFGFTAETQEWYSRRMDAWCERAPKWVNGWLSLEPLLGPIFLNLESVRRSGVQIRWVVVGCESGSQRRPCGMGWVHSIVAQCTEFNIPVFVKQLSTDGRLERDVRMFPESMRIRQVPWTHAYCS